MDEPGGPPLPPITPPIRGVIIRPGVAAAPPRPAPWPPGVRKGVPRTTLGVWMVCFRGVMPSKLES
ncbi:MAG: hypothetical protein MJE68_01885 [Proteobacteria bacterium]|nr:hypothetical protein [Pseudomonadota bacterium]